jgi:hypothetical protein
LVLLIIGGVIFLFVAGCTVLVGIGIFSGGKHASDSSTVAEKGSAVRDGKFEFRVTNVARASTAGDRSNPHETVKP